MPAIIKDGLCIDVSNYLTHDDLLGGKDYTLTIDRVETEQLQLPGSSRKSDCSVIYFAKARKPLVANTTNLRTIRELYGNQVSEWIGKPVTLYPTMTKLKGRPKPCIRIRNGSENDTTPDDNPAA